MRGLFGVFTDVPGQCEGEGHKLVVRAYAKAIRRFGSIMMNYTVPNVHENLAMEYKVVNDGGLGSERRWGVRELKSPIQYKQFQPTDQPK